MDRTVTLPVKTVETLIDIAARQQGVNDVPTLAMFAEVRLQLERAKVGDGRGSGPAIPRVAPFRPTGKLG